MASGQDIAMFTLPPTAGRHASYSRLVHLAESSQLMRSTPEHEAAHFCSERL
jgi:hypothetical protein